MVTTTKTKMSPWLGKAELVSLLLQLLILFLVMPDGCDCQQSSSSYSCSILNPSSTLCPAPQDWQLDKICEPQRQEGSCIDCFDCDPCRSYEYNCELCIANGCFFCPGDALCSSVPYTQVEWDHLQQGLEIGKELHPSCVAIEDWRSTSCSSSTISNGGNTTTTATTEEEAIFSDPLMESMMWLYDMIHIEPVWKSGILGQGIRIRVNDVGGVEATHAEFDDRFDVENSCENYAPPEEGPVVSSISQHGTAVASIALGGAGNGVCAVGLAPEATLSACTLPPVANPKVYAEIMQYNLVEMDVSINSWSLDSCVQREQIARSRRRSQRKLQEDNNSTTTTCPFSNELTSSPCRVCGNSLTTMTDVAQLSSDCRLAIAAYCSSRFEVDPEACSEFLSVYAECDYDSVLTTEELQSLELGVIQGREGKGIIFVMSAGNNYAYGDSTNGQKWTNTRFTISVGAVDKNGKHASYSAIGSSLFVSAPGGDLDHLTNNIVARVGGGCHDISAGTSFSTPVVAGVIGLMLEVNPDLTWRDVQGILASTSEQVDPENESWVTNAAGFHHSYKYGFGLIHAQNAVEAAKSWVPWPPEEFAAVQSERIGLLIPAATEEEEAITTSLTVNLDGLKVQTESVVVLLSIEHPSRGDLDIRLTSPQGTESILHLSPRPENKHLDLASYWELMTVRNWGEDPQGEWTLSLRDSKAGNLADDCVDIPWSFILESTEDIPTGAKVTCSSIARSQTCRNGQPVNQNVALLQDQDLLSPQQACCVCGGGMAPTEQAKLDSWTLVIFGRTSLEAEVEGEESTITDAPTSDSDASPQEDDAEKSVATTQSSNCFLLGITLCLIMLAI